MAFKDNISKIAKTMGDGATNVASSVAKKSGEIVEISKISVTIASEEDKIKDIYGEIGKMVYEKFKKGEELSSEMTDRCTEIKSIEENVVTLKEKINELKNIKICPKCNFEMKLDIAFCPNCGAKQEISEIVVEGNDEVSNCCSEQSSEQSEE